MLEVEWMTAKALALLLWWYAREKSDEEAAEEEWKNWRLHPEANEPAFVFWPITTKDDWCGEFKERP